ncbi:membrane protein insertase YidC [Bacteroidota bacterium]
MDKNQALGLILISILLLVYFYFFAPKSGPQEQPAVTDTGIVQEPIHQETINAKPVEEVEDAIINSTYGVFGTAMKGNEEHVSIENDDVAYTFSSRGAIMHEVKLKEYLTHDSKTLILMNKESSTITEEIQTQHGAINLNKLFYKPEFNSNRVSGNDTLSISFMADIGNGGTVRKIYLIPGSGFQILVKLELKGLDNLINSPVLSYEWDNRIRKVEKDLRQSQIKTSIYYYESIGEYDRLKETSIEKEEENLQGKLDWISFKQKFFTSALISPGHLNGAYITTIGSEIDTSMVKHAYFKTSIQLTDLENDGVRYYFGPNNYQVLKKVSDGFSKNIYLGWTPVNLVNKFLIIPIFNFLDSYIGNYGIIIILLVLIIKILLSPLSYKSYISMAKTKVLKPELDAIKEKHPDDAQKAQSEQMKLYQQVGVNPLSGCVPMLLQMPILFSMFYFFPNSIELRQEGFLWATDLSTYDSILNLPFKVPGYGAHVSLFTLLMTGSTILYTWSNSQVTTVQGPMKTMQYLMPVVFMFVLNSFPAALSFYYFVSNIVTFGQQTLIRKFVDEEKIRLVLDENKKKSGSKKKSKFQQRLEDAMKASDETKKGKKK